MRSSGRAIWTSPPFAKHMRGSTLIALSGKSASIALMLCSNVRKMEAPVVDVSAVPADSPEFVLTRRFDAPREVVYKLWTDPFYVRQWWGVHGSTITTCE